jgi:hypothetical protein
MEVAKRYTKEEAADLYNRLNDEGHGFAIGEDDQTVWEAIRTNDYFLACAFSNGLYHVTKNEREYLVGGDGMMRNAWAVSI